MMLVVSVPGCAVVVIVEGFKCYNLVLLVGTDNSLTKAAPIGEEAGNDQKPDNHFFGC